MESKKKLPTAAARPLFLEVCYKCVAEATNGLDVPTVVRDSGYMNPKEAELRVPFHCNGTRV